MEEKTKESNVESKDLPPRERYRLMLKEAGISEEEAKRRLERVLLDPTPVEWSIEFAEGKRYVLQMLDLEESYKLGENPNQIDVLAHVVVEIPGKDLRNLPLDERKKIVSRFSRPLADFLYNSWVEEMYRHYLICSPIAADFFFKVERR